MNFAFLTDKKALLTATVARAVAHFNELGWGHHASASVRYRASAFILVVVLLALSILIVYATGGTRFSYVHIAYIPIIVAARFFGLRGGLVGGIAAGVVMGPLMPLDVNAWTFQATPNWLTRTGLFCLIGTLSGLSQETLARQLQRAKRRGFIDRVTGLPNRIACQDELQKLLETKPRDDALVYVVSVGLKDFSGIAPVFGSEFSDKLHAAVGARALASIPHLGAFVVAPGVYTLLMSGSAKEATRIAADLMNSLGGQITLDDVPIHLDCHAGLSEQGRHGGDAVTLLRASLVALGDAANSPTSIAWPKGALERHPRLRLLADLKMAIDNREGLTLHYQPIVDLKSGRCSGAEALIRWQHPELGPISPADFIPLAERTALMTPLSDLILDLALTQMSEWRQQQLDLSLAVNLSIKDLENPAFAEHVRRALQNHNVEPCHLHLEMTETALMTQVHTILPNLEALREHGIKISIDDFGQGQSSLSYLSKLPTDILKLDRAFAAEVAENFRTEIVVKAAVDAARALGLKVVAEGIETADTLKRLRALGCDYGQGYLLSRPLPASDFVIWCRQNI
jgi:diguanylate cyclase